MFGMERMHDRSRQVSLPLDREGDVLLLIPAIVFTKNGGTIFEVVDSSDF